MSTGYSRSLTVTHTSTGSNSLTSAAVIGIAMVAAVLVSALVAFVLVEQKLEFSFFHSVVSVQCCYCRRGRSEALPRLNDRAEQRLRDVAVLVCQC